LWKSAKNALTFDLMLAGSKGMKVINAQPETCEKYFCAKKT